MVFFCFVLFFVFSSGTWLPVVVGQIKKVYEQSMKDAEVSEAVVSKGPNEQNKSQFTKVVFSLISCFFLIIIVITVFVNVFFFIVDFCCSLKTRPRTIAKRPYSPESITKRLWMSTPKSGSSGRTT